MFVKRFVYSLCVLTVMVVIFGFSNQTYEQTMKTSDMIVKPIESGVMADTSDFENEKEEQDYIKKLESKLDKAVRKSAHMIIFGVLAVFVYLLCKSFGMHDADAIMLTLLACGLYAGTDELHQKFVNGRTSQFTDVCVDEMGTIISLMCIWVIKKFRVKGN